MPTPPNPDHILFVDGHSVAWRAWFALPDTLRDPSGRPVHALYGFMNILLRVLQDRVPSRLAVTFDRGRPFRADLDAGYKASRRRDSEDVASQVETLRGVLREWRVPVFEADGFEADDVLATLVRQACALGFEVDVLSGDLDILQLVALGVRVVAPGKTFAEPVVYDAARVQERYGIPAAKLRDWKALVGDTSDDIPGVAGIGKKSATELLQRYSGLEEIYAALPAIESARLRTALTAGREAAFHSRRLVDLRSDVPITLTPESARIAGFDARRAATALRGLGMEALANRLVDFNRRYDE